MSEARARAAEGDLIRISRSLPGHEKTQIVPIADRAIAHISRLESQVRECEKHNEILKQSELCLLKEVRDLTNSHSEKVVRKLNEDVAQFRADCIRLSAEVRDLTGERERAVLLGIEGGYRCMCEDPEDTLPEDVRKAALSHIEEIERQLAGMKGA